MKNKKSKNITLEEIRNTLDEFKEITHAREKLLSSAGSKMRIVGTVEKKITRHGGLRFFVRPHVQGEKPLMIFAQFDKPKEIEFAEKEKIKKGSKIELVGGLGSFGIGAVCLNDCRELKQCKK